MDLPNGDVRIPNPKGQGARLREEILAARRLLEEGGSEEAIGLWATAREAAVTAPAIYAHFGGRQELVEAVVGGAFPVGGTAPDSSKLPVPHSG
jgi:AcrR family transcriptional regulator